jgi:HAD superfamily hydrolase (TIGR01509 family)
MPRDVTAVLFDMDGVLIESIDAWYALICDAAQMLSCDPPTMEVYAQHFGQTAHDDAVLFFDDKMSGEALDDYYTQRFSAHMGLVQVMPGARETLAALRAAGRQVACVTNTVVPLAREIQARKGLAELLDAAVAHGDVPHGKPAPDLVFEALRRLGGVEPARAAIVGDSRFDMEAGRAAGVITIGFRRDDGDHRLDDLARLPSLLGV